MTALLPGPDRVAGPTGSFLRSVVRQVCTTVLVLGVVVLLWTVALRVWDVSPYVGKTPAEVWTSLFGDEDSAVLRAEIWTALQQTLIDAAVGFAAGMLAAIVLAAVVVRYKLLEGAVMPVAVVLQTVPLIALAPILILLVGRGYAVVATMSAIVVLFLFGVMLTRAPIGKDAGLDNDQRWTAAVTSLFLLGVLAFVLVDAFADDRLPTLEGVSREELTATRGTGAVGNAIFSTFLVPFEIVSILLLAALVGAIVLARRD